MGKIFLIIVDAFSKWIKVEALNKCTSAVTVTKAQKDFCHAWVASGNC